jgi:hypothetical protein
VVISNKDAGHLSTDFFPAPEIMPAVLTSSRRLRPLSAYGTCTNIGKNPDR